MMKKHYQWLVVGAGFTGSVLAERLARGSDQKVLVIDQRDHIAGNAFDTRNDHGLLYHQYGPHIFHTNAHSIIDYLSAFTEWMPYEHRVLGLVENRLVPIPFNLTSLAILFPKNYADKISDILVKNYGFGKKIPILKLKESNLPEIRELADYVYQNVFLGYTVKQWDLLPEQLSPSVTARVPVHISYDDRYFQDSFQKMPIEGYSKLIKRILDHGNISVALNTSFRDVSSQISFDNVIYTGPIDEFFDFCLGELPYRSLKFEFSVYKQTRHQATGTTNYPSQEQFTRITEMPYLTQEWGNYTTIIKEFPCAHKPGTTIPYYPIPKDSNSELYRKYLNLARKEVKNIHFCGRLGSYQYLNMDQAIGHALSIYKDFALR